MLNPHLPIMFTKSLAYNKNTERATQQKLLISQCLHTIQINELDITNLWHANKLKSLPQ